MNNMSRQGSLMKAIEEGDFCVIMKILVTALAREHHFKQSCSEVSALARFFIITADLRRGRPVKADEE